MQTVTIEQVLKQVEKQQPVSASRAASTSAKSISINKEKLKTLWPTIKTILQFAKMLLPSAKAKNYIDAFIAAAEIVIMGGEEV